MRYKFFGAVVTESWIQNASGYLISNSNREEIFRDFLDVVYHRILIFISKCMYCQYNIFEVLLYGYKY